MIDTILESCVDNPGNLVVVLACFLEPKAFSLDFNPAPALF